MRSTVGHGLFNRLHAEDTQTVCRGQTSTDSEIQGVFFLAQLSFTKTATEQQQKPFLLPQLQTGDAFAIASVCNSKKKKGTSFFYSLFENYE